MRKGLVVAAVACVWIAPPAIGDLYTIDGVTIGYGDVRVDNSWSFAASASGVGSYDLVAVRIASGSDVFKSPAIRNISNASWDMVLDTPTLASFGGLAVTSLSWRTYFQGSLLMAGPLELDWALFKDQQLTHWTHWHVGTDGELDNWWLDPVGGWKPTYSQVVPLPAAVLIGMLGLAAAGLKLRKFV